ncbi:MAG TPA: ChaB family protein [Coxiellaceae bacterium]|nr:ChaB family protein [Coxiellaceae bacterium]
MPYTRLEDLPDSVKQVLPKHAQEIYKGAFKGGYKEYSNEQSAHRVAWAAVKKEYKKDESSGKWKKK